VLLEGIRILLVDDDADVSRVHALMLKRAGAEVHSVPSAGAALAMLSSFRPDVLVSDIWMPDRDGYELIRSLRAMGRENGGEVVAIAVTGSPDRERAIAAGFHVHLTKPVDSQEFTHTLCGLLGR
jgi:CheY-like chemotaxis protein